jgi:p-aminobenzoyl-glutamate transporter AbgT
MIGMFFFGMGATLIGALIVWYVINKVIENDKRKR